MVVLRCSDVPLYLRDSDFYLNLNMDDDDEFELACENFKLDNIVRNDSELEHLLSTLHFWGSVRFSESAMRFVFNCPSEMLASIIDKHGDNFPIISSIDTVRKCEPSKRLNTTIGIGSFELMQFLHREGYAFNGESSEQAAQAGSVSILQYMHEHSCKISTNATKSAATMGHLDCLMYLHSINCPWHEHVGLIAAACGHATCLKYILENGLEPTGMDEICMHAAQDGHHECLQYLIARNFHAPAANWIRCAAVCGNVQCLQLAYNLLRSWPAGITISIINQRNIDCFAYSVSNGCIYASDDVCHIANMGLLEHLQYIKANTLFSFDENTMQCAVREGHLDCVKFLHGAGCPWETNAYATAMEFNRYECMVYMHEQGIDFGPTDCNTAARHGRIRYLQYLHSHHALWDQNTCRTAAEHGRLLCLMYLHDNGCPWDDTTTIAALQNRHQDCYEYAKKHGCLLPPIASRIANWIGL